MYPDSTLDRAFIISKIRSLLGEPAKENGEHKEEKDEDSNGETQEAEKYLTL